VGGDIDGAKVAAGREELRGVERVRVQVVVVGILNWRL
jgi:hypothetical protein